MIWVKIKSYWFANELIRMGEHESWDKLKDHLSECGFHGILMEAIVESDGIRVRLLPAETCLGEVKNR